MNGDTSVSQFFFGFSVQFRMVDDEGLDIISFRRFFKLLLGRQIRVAAVDLNRLPMNAACEKKQKGERKTKLTLLAARKNTAGPNQNFLPSQTTDPVTVPARRDGRLCWERFRRDPLFPQPVSH